MSGEDHFNGTKAVGSRRASVRRTIDRNVVKFCKQAGVNFWSSRKRTDLDFDSGRFVETVESGKRAALSPSTNASGFETGRTVRRADAASRLRSYSVGVMRAINRRHSSLALRCLITRRDGRASPVYAVRHDRPSRSAVSHAEIIVGKAGCVLNIISRR